MTELPSVFTRRLATAAAVAAVALAPFAAGAQSSSGRPVDGIACQAMEGAVFHIHQHLAIFDHGTPVEVPAQIGITNTCLYWVHTHSADGIIHVEAPQFRTFTLANVFDVWGQPLSPTTVASAHVGRGQLHVFVNGKPYAGDPRKIELAQHTDITLEAGPPYKKPELLSDWGGN